MSSDTPDLDRYPELREKWDRRNFIKSAAAGTALMAAGGALFRIAADDLTKQARAEKRRPTRSAWGERTVTRSSARASSPAAGSGWGLRVRRASTALNCSRPPAASRSARSRSSALRSMWRPASRKPTAPR